MTVALVAIVLSVVVILGSAYTLWLTRQTNRKLAEIRRANLEELQVRRAPDLEVDPSDPFLRAAGLPIVVPDEEITEPIHLLLSPHMMACGETAGLGMFDFQADRVTCKDCVEWMEANRGLHPTPPEAA